LIPFLEAVKAISAWREDAVVVSATAALRGWSAVSQCRELDLDISDCMDKAISVGLGIALAQPRRKVLVLDSDSLLRTNLGSLVTVGSAATENLVHFLFEDGSYISTGGQPIPGLDRIDFKAFAESGGYPRTYQFDSLEELVIGIQDVLEGAGPTFVSLKVVQDGDVPGYPDRTMGESLKEVKEALERRVA
jgi:thiamine pyrophosphate-dependent acetolactate synthase large subunit-like protein